MTALYNPVLHFADDDCVSIACSSCEAVEIETKGQRTVTETVRFMMKRFSWIRGGAKGEPLKLHCSECARMIARKKKAEEIAAWIKRKRAGEAR